MGELEAYDSGCFQKIVEAQPRSYDGSPGFDYDHSRVAKGHCAPLLGWTI